MDSSESAKNIDVEREEDFKAELLAIKWLQSLNIELVRALASVLFQEENLPIEKDLQSAEEEQDTQMNGRVSKDEKSLEQESLQKKVDVEEVDTIEFSDRDDDVDRVVEEQLVRHSSRPSSPTQCKACCSRMEGRQ